MPMRSTVRTAWIIVGGALTALIVSWIGLTAWSEVSRTEATGDSYESSLLRPARLSETSVRDYTFTSPELVVRAEGGVDISVVTGAAGRLSVRREIFWSEGGPGPDQGRPNLSERWNGRTLRATVDCPGGTRPGEPVCHAVYTLTVPAATDVEAATRSGTVSAHAVQGDLRLSTGSGEVTVTGARGTLWARAGTGDVTATGLRSAVADVETGRGDAVLGFQHAPDDVRAVAGKSGGVDVTVPDGAGYRVEVDARESTVEVPRDPDAPRRITAVAPEGRLRILPDGRR